MPTASETAPPTTSAEFGSGVMKEGIPKINAIAPPTAKISPIILLMPSRFIIRSISYFPIRRSLIRNDPKVKLITKRNPISKISVKKAWNAINAKSKWKKAMLLHIQKTRSLMLQLGVVLIVNTQNLVSMMYLNEPRLDTKKNLHREPQIGQNQK